MRYVAAIDQGTTGSTALVFDRQGRVAGRAYSEFTQHYPRPGWVEHDAEEIWRVTLRVLRQAVARPLLLFLEPLADDVVAELDALVADEHRRAGDQLAHLVLALAAEGAIQQLAVVVLAPRVVDHCGPRSPGGRQPSYSMPVSAGKILFISTSCRF